jgi:hypothetical protein
MIQGTDDDNLESGEGADKVEKESKASWLVSL